MTRCRIPLTHPDHLTTLSFLLLVHLLNPPSFLSQGCTLLNNSEWTSQQRSTFGRRLDSSKDVICREGELGKEEQEEDHGAANGC